MKNHHTKSVVFELNNRQYEVVFCALVFMDDNGKFESVDIERWLEYGYDNVTGFEKTFEGTRIEEMPVHIESHFNKFAQELEAQYA